jgi:hypothetical protein
MKIDQGKCECVSGLPLKIDHFEYLGRSPMKIDQGKCGCIGRSPVKTDQFSSKGAGCPR